MDPSSLALLTLAIVIGLLMLRVPVAFCLGLAAVIGLFLFFGWRPGAAPDFSRAIQPVLSILSNSPYDFVSSYDLSMIPLFIGLGFVASEVGITTDLYYSLRVWLARVPGGLAAASVMGCAGFSAITGSSVACASAMGKISIPEMLRYGYSPRLACGAVAAGGTLGSLIPPSLLFVIYAIFTEQSVKHLFLAGIVPGILSLAGYLITIWIWVLRNPAAAPPPSGIATTREARLQAAAQTWPAVLLLVVIIVGIYWGFFTPTEAAAVSLALAIAIGIARRRLSWKQFVVAFRETVLQSAMIFMIAIGAKIFVAFVSLTRISPMLLEWLQGTDASIIQILIAVVLLYLVLGMFLDSIGILVLTLPFTVPLMEGYGFDLVWFGVIVIKLLEIGLITPPVGLNVFVIKSVAPRNVTLETVFMGACWFLILDLVVLALLLTFPALSLLIPNSAG